MSGSEFVRRYAPVPRASYKPPSRSQYSSLATALKRLRALRGTRIQVGRTGLPPLFYGDTERVYLQSEAPPSMLAQAPPQHDIVKPQNDAIKPRDALLGTWVPEAWQTLGVEAAGCSNFWVSTQGLVSPLHYDATHSFLAQVPSPRP
eukprot:1401812-Rhodomonas_salina.1